MTREVSVKRLCPRCGSSIETVVYSTVDATVPSHREEPSATYCGSCIAENLIAGKA